MFYLVSFCQESKPDLPKFSIRSNISIPKVVSSNAFRNSFAGAITADINFDYKLFSNFYCGLGYAYTYFKPQKVFRDQRVNSNLQAQNGYLKLGYDHFFSNTGFISTSLNTGYNYSSFNGNVYKNDSLKGKYPTTFSTIFIEPMVGVYFIVDPNFAIGATLSYNYNFAKFNPDYAGYNQWFTYKNVKNNWNMSMITFGFGFYYGLSKK
jgi:hypothetical protein